MDPIRIDRDRLWGHLRALCEDIGPRVCGTDADERTVRFLQGHFEKCGVPVEIQDYPCPGWDHESTRLELVTPDGPKPLDATAQMFSEGCDVEAQLACVESLHDIEYHPGLEGKIVVLAAGAAVNTDRNPWLLAIEGRRPEALIVIGPHDDVPLTKQVRDPFARVPVAGVSRMVGKELEGSDGQRARLRIEARRYDSVSHNVIARLPGETDQRIVMGGHYDTAPDTVGAGDDGSGIAVLMEVCQVLAARPQVAPSRGADRRPRKAAIDIVAFGAEEYGRFWESGYGGALGSCEYVRRHHEELRQTQAMIQVDFVGTAVAPPLVFLHGWPADRQESILEALRAFPDQQVEAERSIGGDNHHFARNGVPTLAFSNSWNEVAIHTALDTMDNLDPEKLAFTARVVAAMAERLAGPEQSE